VQAELFGELAVLVADFGAQSALAEADRAERYSVVLNTAGTSIDVVAQVGDLRGSVPVVA